jgi:uncharacterized protein (DUF433 family)
MTARDKTPMPDNAQPEVKATRIHSDRVTSDPRICSGKSCSKGTRIPVHIILDLLAAGESYEGIRRAYPAHYRLRHSGLHQLGRIVGRGGGRGPHVNIPVSTASVRRYRSRRALPDSGARRHGIVQELLGITDACADSRAAGHDHPRRRQNQNFSPTAGLTRVPALGNLLLWSLSEN